MPLPPPADEPARAAALARLGVLDTPPEGDFDDLTRLAAHLCGTPIALVSLLDAGRQWFKSRYGLDASETPRAWAFCDHAVRQPGVFEVPDAAADGRFADNPLVTGEPLIRFYAGVPLEADGVAVGTLCVIDRTPRALTPAQRDGLRTLGRQVATLLRLRRQAADQAREHETVRVLFEQSSDAHLLFDERDGILDCNHAAVAMLRLTRKEEVLALHPAVLSPEFQPCGRRSLDKCVDMDAAARRDGYHRFDWTHRRADGEEFPCEVTLTPVELHGRGVLLVVWHDLSERRRAEDALRASEERLRLATQAAGVGIWEWNVLTDQIYWNAQMFELYHVAPTPDGLVTYETWSGAVLPDDLAYQEAALRDTVRRRGSSTREFRIGRPDGDVRHIEAAETVRANARGQAEWVTGTNVDVTRRKHAQAALRASEERFRAFMDNGPALAFVKDADGRFVYVNGPCCRRFEIAEADWLGRTDADLWEPAVAAALRETDVRVLAGNRTLKVLESVPTPDGAGQHWQSYKFPLTGPDGRRYLAGMTVDVTAEKRAEEALRQSEERFRAATEGSLNAVFFLAAERDAAGRVTDFRFTDVNHHGARLVSREPEDVLGRRLCDLLPVNRTAGFFDKYVRVLETGETLEEEFPIAADGVVAGWLHHQVVRAGDGVAITSQDITDRKRAEAELRESEAKFRGVVDDLAEGVVLLDYGTRAVLRTNRALLDLLGYADGEFAALTQYDFVAHEPADIDAKMAEVVAAGRSDLGFRKYRRKDGTPVDVSVNGSRLTLDGRTVLCLAVRDMTEHREYEERLLAYQAELERANAALHARANTDALTGLNNRAALNDKLREEFDRAARTALPLSAVLLDVDHFKGFNDAFGHPAGDAVLKRVAGVLAETVRGTDFVARYGGEEFAILLPDTDRAGSLVLAERCRRAVAAAHWDRRPVTVSVGVCTLTPDTPDPAALVQQADDALYRSKHAGRNRVSHFTAAPRPVPV